MHLYPYGVVPYDQLTEEKEIRASLTDGSACYAGISQKWKALQTLSGITMKDISECKLSQQVELLTVHMDSTHWTVHILLGRINGHMCNCSLIHGV